MESDDEFVFYSEDDEILNFDEEPEWDSNIEEEVEILPEMGAFERISRGRADIGDQNLPDNLRKLVRMNLTDEQIFLKNVDFYISKLQEKLFNHYNTNVILENIHNIPDIKYKNPLAYVLGFFVLDNDKINKKNVKLIENTILNQQVSEESSENFGDIVSPPDIIRYARFILANR
jgi:hypothetical protein